MSRIGSPSFSLRIQWISLIVIVAAASGGWADTGPDAAGEVSARLVAPAGEITVGDLVVLKLTVSHPPGTVFETPVTGGLEGEGSRRPFVVERVDPLEIDPPDPGETVWSIQIRPFSTGEIAIPELILRYRLPSAAEEQTVSTEPIAMTVRSVLESAEEEPADIKGQWVLPLDAWRILLYLLAALLAAAAGFLLWRAHRCRARRKMPEPALPPSPSEPPYDRALRELERLLACGLISQGKVKEFHVALSEIVKRFLGDYHGFNALDRTTQEVLADLSRAGRGAPLVEETRAFLGACDLVKFAKHRAPQQEIDATISAARRLIETGRPVRDEEAA